MADYELGVAMAGKGRYLAKQDNYEVHRENGGMVVYSVWTEQGEKRGLEVGYLADLENFSSVVEELQYENKLALRELEKEFGVCFG